MDIATIDQPKPPTRQALAIEGRSSRGKVTGKLKVAMDAMIWEGKTRDEAAQHAGLSIHGLREALKRPHVRAYYRSEIEVLRENERARNLHALVEVRDQKTNHMARVQAVKALEQISETDTPTSGASPSPGVTIRIINQAPASPPLIDVSPTQVTHD